MAYAHQRVTLLMFPKEDEQFCARVQSLKGTDGVVADHLEQQLRTVYPHATVRRRDALGELDPTAETWYVYRDGSLSPHQAEHDERGWARPAEAASAGAD